MLPKYTVAENKSGRREIRWLDTKACMQDLVQAIQETFPGKSLDQVFISMDWLEGPITMTIDLDPFNY